MADLETSVRAIALAARKASAVLARTTTDQRNAALLAMARALREHSAAIVEANAEDMRAGRAAGMSEGLLDRLELNEQRVEGMASALESIGVGFPILSVACLRSARNQRGHAAAAHKRSARRGGHGLRSAPERDRRCGGNLSQGGKCLRAARRLSGAAFEHRADEGLARCGAKGRPSCR